MAADSGEIHKLDVGRDRLAGRRRRHWVFSFCIHCTIPHDALKRVVGILLEQLLEGRAKPLRWWRLLSFVSRPFRIR